jgi:hypothetical protein
MNDSIANTQVDSDSHCPSSLYRTFKHYIRLHSLVHHHLDDQPLHLTILFWLGGDHVVASAVAVLAMGMLEHFFRLAGGQPPFVQHLPLLLLGVLLTLILGLSAWVLFHIGLIWLMCGTQGIAAGVLLTISCVRKRRQTGDMLSE